MTAAVGWPKPGGGTVVPLARERLEDEELEVQDVEVVAPTSSEVHSGSVPKDSRVTIDPLRMPGRNDESDPAAIEDLIAPILPRGWPKPSGGAGEPTELDMSSAEWPKPGGGTGAPTG